MSTKWRILIVEDKEDIANQIAEAVPQFVVAPDTAEADICRTFKEADARLNSERYDILILDLKEDDNAWGLAPESEAGLAIFDSLKKTRFVPVIFYTALAHKVRDLETNFVRVVEKTESVDRVKEEVQRVIKTQLPALARQIEEVQRSYMWDFVSRHWKEFKEPAEQADVAYLMARRLAIELQSTAAKLAADLGATKPTEAKTRAHPMALYVFPSIGPHPRAGDIVAEQLEGKDVYWVVLTPSCDLAQSKADHVLLAKCQPLIERQEFKKWTQDKNSNKQPFEQLLEDRKSDRYKFLPRTFFIPDLVVDLQQLRSIDRAAFGTLRQVASLDSPFAESLVARFSRYFTRLGTPDIDKAAVLARIITPQVGSA